MSSLRVGQWLAVTIGVLFVCAVIGIGLALSANSRLTDRRHLLVDQITPAQLAALGLENALVNQETGVRGYLFTHRAQFLQPYHSGIQAEALSYRRLDAIRHGRAAASAADVDLVHARARAWQRAFVAPVLERARGRSATMLLSVGKGRFDAIRRALTRLQGGLAARRAHARHELDAAARVLKVTLILAGLLIVAGVLGAALVLRRIVTVPLARLGRDARRVAAGDFDAALRPTRGAREIVAVHGDVDAMRKRIVHELAAGRIANDRLGVQALELTRSNAELEQFAYVASHDLQEPLRKVASFCQALERRYHGQLDERADQYIEFAVDGAKRMQVLINDLLAFSRVGRSGREHELLDASEIVSEARSSLAATLEESHATVEVSELPVVLGDRALLVSVFQNLIGNAVKFRGTEPPVVRIEAHRQEPDWQFSCTDNGIGIDPEYTERIFVIFQRLHPKDAYPGTGIGLAMCRKIIESHGGRIWLDADHVDGTRFRFTLPIPEEAHP